MRDLQWSRELSLVVTADTLAARQAFKTLDTDIDHVGQSSTKAGAQIDVLETSIEKSATGADSMSLSLNGLAESAGLTFEKVGALNSVFLAFGTLVTSYKLTSAVLEFTGLDKAIADAADSWGHYSQRIENEIAAANHDKLAIQAQHLQNILAQGPKILQNWHNEIANLGPAQLQFIKDIDSHAYSLEQLHVKYNVSVQAIKNFETEMREGAADAKRASDIEIKAIHDNLKAQEAFTKAFKHAVAERREALEESLSGVVKYYQALQAADLKAVNAVVVANIMAKKELEGPTTMSPFEKYQHDVEALHKSAPAGIDISASEQKLFNDFQKSFDSASTAADHLAESSEKAAGAGDMVSAGFDRAGASALSVADMFNRAAGVVSPGTDRIANDALSSAYGRAGFVAHQSISGILPASMAPIAPGSGGMSFGDIHIHGDVDSELRVRQLTDKVSRNILDKLRAQQKGPLTKPS